MTKQNFLKGAAILGIAGIVVKLLGAVYRIPLVNIISSDGMGYYQTSYPLYTLLLVISTAGFPTAVAKIVSEKRALGNYKGAYRVFKIAFFSMTFIGILTSLIVFLNAKSIVRLIGNNNAYYSLLALTPALLFVPIMSSFRGYFQGRQIMSPTAISQIVEQLFRVGIGLFLAYYLLNYGLPQAAGGAAFGASAGAIAGTIGIIVIFLLNKKHIKNEISRGTNCSLESVSTILKKLLLIAIPITIGAAIVPVMNNIDVIIVLRRLRTAGFTEAEANALYGQLGGMAQTLINFPQVFSMAIAMSLVPAVSEAFARRNYSEIKNITLSGVRVTLLIGLPAALGLYILSTPIIKLLYFNEEIATLKNTGQILQILAFSVLFLTLVQSLTAILQGLGKPMVPVKNLALGAIVKIIVTFILVGIPSINVRGAAIGTVFAYMTAATLNFIAVKQYTKTTFKIINTFIKPVLSVIVMTVSVWGSFIYMTPILGEKLATLGAMGVGAIVYGLALLLLGIISTSDFELIPGGNKISKILKRVGLLRK